MIESKKYLEEEKKKQADNIFSVAEKPLSLTCPELFTLFKGLYED